MEAVAPPPSGMSLPVNSSTMTPFHLHYIIHISLEECVSPKSLIDVMQRFDVSRIVEVST